MAVRYAANNGNWGSGSTWDGGLTIPGAGDTVYLNNKTVTVNVDVLIGGENDYNVNAGSFIAGCYYTVVSQGSPTPTDFTVIGSSSNTAGTRFRATGPGTGDGVAKTRASISVAAYSPAVAGGILTPVAGRTISADIFGGANLLNFSYVSPAEFYIVGDIRALTEGNLITNSSSGKLFVTGKCYSASTGSPSYVLGNASSGTIVFTGSAYGGSLSANARCIHNYGNGTIQITCDVLQSGSFGAAILNSSAGTVTGTVSTILGGTASTSPGSIHNASTGSVTVSVGNAIGGSGAAIANTGGGTVSVYGIASGGASGGAGVQNEGAGLVYVTRAVGNQYGLGGTHAIGAPGVRGFNVGKTYVDEIQFGDYGHTPIFGSVFLSSTASEPKAIFLEGPLSTVRTLVDATTAPGALPAPSDVRADVDYNYGATTGTCNVPPASSVAFGVPVDNTTGTAVITPAAVQAIVGAAVAAAVTND